MLGATLPALPRESERAGRRRLGAEPVIACLKKNEFLKY